MLSTKRFSVIFFLLLLLFTLDSLSQAFPTTDPILYDIFPFIRVYKNGTIQRFIGQDIAPPSNDPATGVRSKDVVFSPHLNLSARLYLPRNAAGRKLPVLIYFHGGGFFTESAFSPTYHRHLNSLVARSRVVAVSVNYRLAPEHPLPAAYEDSWLALKWTLSHRGGGGGGGGGGAEPWLKTYADFGSLFLGGDSAGANIAHHVATRIGLEKPDPGIKVRGMFLNCPYFLGKKAIGNESAQAYMYAEAQMQKLWRYAYPNSKGFDDPLVNPGMDPGLRMVGCRRILVYVAGNDVLKYRGRYYAAALGLSGWKGEVKVVEVEGESHVFNLINPNSPKAVAMLRVLASFLRHS